MSDIDLTEAVAAATSVMLDEGHNGLHDCRPDHSLDVSVEEALRAALPAIREQLARKIETLPDLTMPGYFATQPSDLIRQDTAARIVRGER